METDKQYQEQEMECIEVGSIEEQLERVKKMRTLSKMHHQLSSDLESLHFLAGQPSTEKTLLQPQIRAVIKEMFSLIESDLYLINQFNPYPGYKDKDSLVDKFKSTYKHHGKTFKKEQLVNEFQSRHFEQFSRIKIKRDDLMHPKGPTSIRVGLEDLEDTYTFYQTYRDFVVRMMTNVGVAINIPLSQLLR